MDEESNITIPSLLAATVEHHADEPALAFIRAGALHWRTWREVWDDAQSLAASLRLAGIQPRDRVAHVSENRYEWVITDLALHLAGAVHVPIHVTLPGAQIADQIAGCGARLVFVSSEDLLAKFVGLIDDRVNVIVHDQAACGLAAAKPPAAPPTPSRQPPTPTDLATILYTSGTVARPRGVMLSQRNLAGNARALVDAHGGGRDQTRLCILPFSHIYARTCDLYTWIARGSRLVLAESRTTLLRDLALVRPTALNAVPYVYQKIADGVRNSPPLDGEGCSGEAAALKHILGGRIERLTCGGAALAPQTEAWYARCGMPVLCGYGLTETSPAVTTSTRRAHRLGCVGRPIPGVEVRTAADGEVFVRGPNVMLGYWQDTAATGEAIRDGWLATGDLGQLDDDGFLSIVGRKKELIVLSTGKNVSPTRVENLLTASPLIDGAAVFGDGRRSLVALIVPDQNALTAAGGLATNDHQEIRRVIVAEVDRCLAEAAPEERVRDVVFADRSFSIERGELTPKLSLCRHVIARNFAALLAAHSRGRGQPARRSKPPGPHAERPLPASDGL